MIEATSLKNGTTFLINQKPYVVIKYTHQKIGRGGASVKVTLRDLESGNSVQKTFNSNMKFQEINTLKKKTQYLYSDGSFAYFMDPDTFNQIEIPVKVVEDQISFFKEGENVDVHYWEDRVLSVDIPPKVSLKVVDTTPGVKGNTTSNVYKSAKLENGMSVKVPLFIQNGDIVRVDTRTGEYMERAK